MAIESTNAIPTRQSLLSRLKNWNDQESWNDFFNIYWKLIYNAARQSGLADAEAQDVVQETVIAVSKQMPDFKYDKERGSFKGWLLQLTRWRIIDQIRKRLPAGSVSLQASDGRGENHNQAAQDIADPAGIDLEAIWEHEWNQNLMDAAIERVKLKADSKQYQIFDLYVLKEWPVLKIAQMLQISAPRIYLIKHRISAMIKRELQNLERNTL